MLATKKREGFKGQRAIVLPQKILTSQCEAHPVVKRLYITDIGYYPNALHHHRQRNHGIDQHILIYCVKGIGWANIRGNSYTVSPGDRSEEHTSELQSQSNLVCRLLLEKKKI